MYSLKKFSFFLLSLAFANILMSGCTLANRNSGKSIAPETRESLSQGKGDAYSFKVRIFRDGKKNSANFDIYYNRDSLAFFAKGYLGKGVLKGLIVRDSAVAYFPTENEFYFGKIADLVNSDCFAGLEFERLILDLFFETPDKLGYSPAGYYLKIDKNKSSDKRFRLISSACDEQLYIKYDVEENRFIPENIEYSANDGSFKLIAERTRRKLNADIPAEKFEVPIPPSAVRIRP